MKLIEFIVNDKLRIYFIQDLSLLSGNELIHLNDFGKLIDENWFYFYSSEFSEASLWRGTNN